MIVNDIDFVGIKGVVNLLRRNYNYLVRLLRVKQIWKKEFINICYDYLKSLRNKDL